MKPEKEKKAVETPEVKAAAGAAPETPDPAQRLAEMEEDLTLLLRDGHEFKTVKGVVLKVPAVTGTVEKRTFKTIINFLRGHADLIGKTFSGEKKLKPDDVIGFLVNILDDSYDVTQAIAAEFLGKTPEWAEKNLLAADIVKIISPFLKAEAKPIAALMSTQPGKIGASLGRMKAMAMAFYRAGGLK